MTPDNLQFRTGVIKPVECVKEGWALIKDQYWLFLGIVFVGGFVAGAVPLVLIGPMMVGIYLCFLRKMRGEPVDFSHLFKGFDFFAQGLIAALIQAIPMIIVIVPLYVIMFAFMMVSGARQGGGRMDPNEASGFALTFLLIYLVFIVLVVVVAVIVTIFFLFTFPLIADRNLSGVDAVKLSIKAARANLGGVIGLVVVNVGVGLLGVLCCYFGVLFVMPVSMASYAIAYRRVFPESSHNFASPPPPPANWAA